MTDDQIPDLSENWEKSLERVRRVNARSDVHGMTRPLRNPDEREFLRRIGREGPLQEVALTKPFAEAITRASELPVSVQDRVAAIMLEIIERDLA
jgi:hypothetical protein